MSYGWMGLILKVDLTTGEISNEKTDRYLPEYLGGRALAARIGWEGIPAGIDAYDARNRIIVATGPLTGTLAPTSGRTLMTGVSPRTYPMNWYTFSTLGGWFGPELKYAGFDAVVITGKAAAPVLLEIVDGEAALRDANDLWGLDTRETQLALKERLGQAAQVLTIGPAGENLVRFATVQHAEENAAGHSGFGAVWGDKNLKAIVARGSEGVPVADPELVLEEVLAAGSGHTTPPIAVTFEGGMDWYRGDPAEVEAQQPAVEEPPPEAEEEEDERRPTCSQGCTFNCIVGALERTIDGRLIPGFCLGADWRQNILMQATKYEGGGVTVPKGTHFGHCEEVTLHELCNTLGIDLWFRLVMQPWFVRCQQLGIDQIRGHPVLPDDVTWFEAFVYQLARREGLGAIFAEDLRRAVDMLEDELPPELIRLGHQLEFNFGFPAHREGRFWDEEPFPFWVISAMMHISESRDPSIGSHQSSLLHAEFFLTDNELASRQFRLISEKVFGYPDAFEASFENKAPITIWSQNQHMIIDSLPVCDFAFPQLVRPLENRADWESSEDISGDLGLGRRLLNAVTGMDYSEDDLSLVAQRAFTLERLMLARAGRDRALEETLAPHFELPCRADGTLIDKAGFLRLMDEYYAARSWDLKRGWPTAESLRGLGLEEILPDLEGILQSEVKD